MNLLFHSEKLSERTGRAVKALTILSALAVLTFFGLCGYLLWDGHRDAQKKAATATGNVAQVLTNDIQRTFDGFQLSFSTLIERIQNPKLLSLPRAAAEDLLFGQLRSSSYVQNVQVTDATGRVILDADGRDRPDSTYANNLTFLARRANPDTGLFVSKPYLSHTTQNYVVLLTQRYNHSDGSFGGIIAAALSLEYFDTLFDVVDIGQKGIISIVGTDGGLISRRPFRLKEIGIDLSSSPLFTKLADSPSGDFDTDGVLDKVSRHFNYRKLKNLPLIINVGLATDEIFANWRGKLLILSGAMAVFAASIAGFAYVLVGELQRRHHAEAELERVASRDGLTGVANRRSFDAYLSEACQIASMTGKPLSLLMIDVDNFKSYNDHYGHSAGDKVLKLIAGCLDSVSETRNGVCARYGGEEFAIILQAADKETAHRLAVELTQAVRDLEIAHRNGVNGLVTVSIGIGCIFERVPAAEALVVEADNALYLAKDRGRNRVEIQDADDDLSAAGRTVRSDRA